MFENRKFYRIPSLARFVLGGSQKIVTGRCTNISFGGGFIQLLDVGSLKSGDVLKCDFLLQESGQVLTAQAEIRRVSQGSPDPTEPVGIGISFSELIGNSQKELSQFILDQKRVYEILGALLMNTEPDLRSIRPLISKLPLQRQLNLRDLRLFVEATLKAIQLVEQKGGAQPPSPVIS
jgi:hypothetical protein